MKRVYHTKEELFDLRNRIPVKRVIESLKIPVKTDDGYFRFCCPLCNNHTTAINPQANLARCFSCKRNFNPIDLVIAAKGLSFAQTINYLRNLKEPTLIQTAEKLPDKESNRPPSSPVSIRSIIEQINLPAPLKTSPDKKSDVMSTDDLQSLNQRIQSIESHLQTIIRKLQHIETDINNW